MAHPGLAIIDQPGRDSHGLKPAIDRRLAVSLDKATMDYVDHFKKPDLDVARRKRRPVSVSYLPVDVHDRFECYLSHW